MLKGKVMRNMFILFLVAGLLLGGTISAVAADYKLTLGHCNEPTRDSIFHLVALEFKERVEEKTDGKVEVQIYPASQLGSEQEQVRSLQLGQQDVTLVSMTNFNPYAKSLNFFTLPYIFENTEQGRRVIDAMWDQLNEWAVDEAGCRILSLMDAGFRHISNSKKEITTLEDLQDVKIRVPQNEILIGTFKSWGVDPIPMAWSETFNALQQKVVDGQENPYNVLVAMRFYEIQKYVTASGHIFQTSVVLLSDRTYQSLPTDIRDKVVEAGREVMEFERNYVSETIEKDKERLREEGMILSGAPEDKEEWISRARTIWDQFYESIGDGDAEKGKEIVELVESYK